MSGVLEEASYCRSEAPPICIVLHPHLSVFDIVLHCVQDFFGIGDAHDLEIHVAELDREEHLVLPSDQDGAVLDLGADFETDTFSREEDELGDVPYPQHLRVIEEQGSYF